MDRTVRELTGKTLTGKTKGAIVRPMVEWFAGACGEGALRDLAYALPEPVRDEISPEAPALGLLTAGWYSEALASELADAIVKRAHGQQTELAIVKTLGARIIDRTLGRISRAAVEWLATPSTIAGSASLFWRMYHDAGAIEARVEGSSIVARNATWGPHGQMWCRIVGSSAVHVLELAGCQDARLWVHKCGGGQGECSMVLRWSGISG
jgi:hypothetical protein